MCHAAEIEGLFKLNYVTQDVMMVGWACMSGADGAHL